MTRPARRALALALATLGLAACTRAGREGPPRAAAPLAGPADSVLVRFTTSQGEFDVMLRRHWAPLGAARVAEAVDSGYYDGARFFRVLRGFVAQFGLAADSAATAAWRERRLADDPVTQSNRRGTLTFAAGGPNTRTVQLFVNLRDNARLDGMGFAPVGEVVRGMDVVAALHAGYGEASPAGRGPTQERISAGGEAYLAAEFPQLDRIVSARAIARWGAAR